MPRLRFVRYRIQADFGLQSYLRVSVVAKSSPQRKTTPPRKSPSNQASALLSQQPSAASQLEAPARRKAPLALTFDARDKHRQPSMVEHSSAAADTRRQFALTALLSPRQASRRSKLGLARQGSLDLTSSPKSVRRALELAEDGVLPFQSNAAVGGGSPVLARRTGSAEHLMRDATDGPMAEPGGSAPSSPLLQKRPSALVLASSYQAAMGSDSCLAHDGDGPARARAMSSPSKFPGRSNSSAPSTPVRGRAASERRATPRKASKPSRIATVAAKLDFKATVAAAIAAGAAPTPASHGRQPVESSLPVSSLSAGVGAAAHPLPPGRQRRLHQQNSADVLPLGREPSKKAVSRTVSGLASGSVDGMRRSQEEHVKENVRIGLLSCRQGCGKTVVSGRAFRTLTCALPASAPGQADPGTTLSAADAAKLRAIGMTEEEIHGQAFLEETVI